MHIEFNVTEYLEKLQKKGITDAQAIELLKEEQDRFLLIEKAIEQSKREIKSEIEAKQLATKDDIEIAKLKLEKEIIANREEIEKLRADVVDKISSSNRWVIGTVVIGFILTSLPRILETFSKLS